MSEDWTILRRVNFEYEPDFAIWDKIDKKIYYKFAKIRFWNNTVQLTYEGNKWRTFSNIIFLRFTGCYTKKHPIYEGVVLKNPEGSYYVVYFDEVLKSFKMVSSPLLPKSEIKDLPKTLEESEQYHCLGFIQQNPGMLRDGTKMRAFKNGFETKK